MAAIDDAIHSYLGQGATVGSQVYFDSGSDPAHGRFHGTNAPEWIDDGGRLVTNFPATAGSANTTQDVPRIALNNHLGVGDGDFSYAMWLKMNSTNSNALALISTEYRGGSSYQGHRLDVHGGRQLGLSCKTDSASKLTLSSTSLTLNEWAAIVVTYSYSTSTPAIYIDGVTPSFYSGLAPSDVSTTLGANGNIASARTHQYQHVGYLGADGPNSSMFTSNNIFDSYFLGPVVWDRVISLSEITELVTMPDAPSSSGGTAGYSRARITNGA